MRLTPTTRRDALRDSPLATTPAGTASDPVSAAIEAHRTARAVLTAACVEADEAPDDGPEGTPALAALDAASAAETATWEALLASRPADADGLVRMLRYVAGAAPMEVLGDARDLGRHLAEAAEHALLPSRVLASEASGSDPVLALIAEHRAAYAEWDRTSAVWNNMVPDAPGYVEAQSASDAPGRREMAAYEALFTARPTTLPGTLALAEYLGEAVRRVRIDAEPTDGEMALQTVTAALRGLAVADGTALAAGPSLRALVASWEAAERAANASGLSDDEREPLIDRATTLQRAVYAFPAHTLAELCAKLPAFRDEATIAGAPADGRGEPETLEECALQGLVADLERLAAHHAVTIKPRLKAPDPALSAYAASRRAEAVMATFEDNGEEEHVWRAREDEAAATQLGMRAAAWVAVPTTHAGRRALVDYARFQVGVFTGPSGKIDQPEDLIRDILDAIAAAIDAEGPEPDGADQRQRLDEFAEEGEGSQERLNVDLTVRPSRHACPGCARP